VARLVFVSSARRDLADIAAYIEARSGNRAAADAFIDKLTDYCAHLATLPGLMGRPRVELRPEFRSVTFGSYVIFLRYDTEGTSPNEILQIVHVLHGARDMDAYFAASPDDDVT
jgi:toxin ParE1/3/4